jgi:hypothetical protein
MDRRVLEILTNKPEIITGFPGWMLPESRIKQLRETVGLAVVEIAGRDSIAAAILATKLRDIEAILPTINFTGTEFGNWNEPFEKVELLRHAVGKKGIKVFEPVILGAPAFWRLLCGRYTSYMLRKYGTYSPCVGCHLYFHSIRIPIATMVNCSLVIGGERESHDGKIKVNQIPVALEAYTSFVRRFGIELFLPIRDVHSGKEIEAIIGTRWEEGTGQLECVLSKNYLDMESRVVYSDEAVRMFLEDFAVPTAEKMVRKFLAEIRKQGTR